MKTAAETGRLRRVATARMPTKWGMFHATGFERTVANGITRTESALAIVMGDLMAEAPLLRIHFQCFTGEALGSICISLAPGLISARTRRAPGKSFFCTINQSGLCRSRTENPRVRR